MERYKPSPSQLLWALVDVVATLGEVAATVTGPQRDEQQRASPESLRSFAWSLRNALNHRGVTSPSYISVPSLGQALATLASTPEDTWAKVRDAATAWRYRVDMLAESWFFLAWGASEFCEASEDEASEDEATTAATTEATTEATAQAGDLQDEATRRETAGDNPVAMAQQPPVALDREEVASAGAMPKARVAAASEEEEEAASEEEEEAASNEEAVTRREQRSQAALGPLERLVVACERARYFVFEMIDRLKEIEAILKGTNEASPDVPEDLVAKVAEAERLWEASARLATRHLLGILGDIVRLLTKPPGGPGASGGPGGSDGPGGSGGSDGSDGRTVAKKCQEAIEDIPRLLRGE